jgi:hypothetical protein
VAAAAVVTARGNGSYAVAYSVPEDAALLLLTVTLDGQVGCCLLLSLPRLASHVFRFVCAWVFACARGVICAGMCLAVI